MTKKDKEELDASRRLVVVYMDKLLIAEDAILTLFEKIKHGDENHQRWLKETLDNHFKGIV